MASEFESIIKELPTLKAPGVSGSRIKKLTEIAISNVSDEANIIQILYSNCKAAPSSHKLGTLYVVDSIVRGLLEEAKKNKQTVNADAPQGTYAAAVFKITELIESIVDDALELLVSKSQNTKIGKLVDIWERADTFLPELIARIREKHFKSTTPPGSPPRASVEPAKPAGSGDSGSILLALASLAKTANSNSSTPTTTTAVPVENNANNVLLQLSALAKPQLGSSAPAVANGAPAQNEQQIFSMLQLMQNGAGTNPAPAVPAISQGGGPNLPNIPNVGGARGRYDDSSSYSRRNRSRSPNRGAQPRRERSPPRAYGGQGQPMGQMGGYMGGPGKPPMGQPGQPMGQPGQPGQPMGQHMGQPGQPMGQPMGQPGQPMGQPMGRMGQMGQMGQPMNQPMGQMNQPMNQGGEDGPMNPGELNIPGSAHYRPRNVGFDPSLPQGSFKVLSRTLFIGGVPRHMYEQDLANVLRPYAEVQSVILNSERKHAFVKVYSRHEAEQVITSFAKENTMGLRTRWGVGFGPRDCCNYQHGISIIPIQRLTDADRAWVVQAQWGGTGGQPLLSGMVIDEPDIEIGTGISSKAMSKKMPTNSARNGPKSNRPGEPDEDYVKTTLIPQQTTMSHGATPDFNTFLQSSVNPLSGLFNNNGGNSPQLPVNPAMAQAGNMQGYQQNQGQNPNLGAQLANFFQNGGR